MTKITLDWFLAAVNRAVRTMAQTALSMFTINAAIGELDWVRIISVSAVAGAYSMLTSIATGLPEASGDGKLLIDTTGEKDIYRMEFDVDLDTLATRSHVLLKVNSDAKLNDSQE